MFLYALLACTPTPEKPSDDRDGDGVPDAADCAPDDPSVATSTSAYADADGDGYGDATGPVEVCGSAEGTTSDATDCDDAAAEVHPGATEIWYDGADEDCAGDDDFDQDGDGWTRDEECDDTDASRTPDAAIPEVWYDGVDDNCDGNDGDQDGDGWYAVDYPYAVPPAYAGHTGDCADDPAHPPSPAEGAPAVPASAIHPEAPDVPYDGIDAACDGGDDFDADGDGHASAGHPDADGQVGDDCDDGDPDVHPGVPERCETTADDDCDGEANEVDAAGCSEWYADGDGDGAGGVGACLCTADSGHPLSTSTDCDDANPDVRPGADELCDGLDDDCDGLVDEGLPATYPDLDGDGHGAGAPSCGASDGVSSADDCDDTDASVHPDAPEVCDGLDQDCDGVPDDGLPLRYADVDGDGHGAGVPSCAESVAEGDDCDDADPYVHPGATELCDGLQNDCDDRSWGADREDGTASVEASDGSWLDVTDALGGSTFAFLTYVLPAEGTLWLCAGTWHNALTTPASGSTSAVIGRYGADATRMDAGGAGSVITATTSDLALSVEGLTLTGGAAYQGGGLYILGADVTLTGVHLDGNSASQDGGGAYLVGGSLTLVDSTVAGNEAVRVGGGIYAESADLTLETTSVTGNLLRTGVDNGYGAGVAWYSADTVTLSATGGSISDNTADGTGSILEGVGLYAVTVGTGDILLDGVTLSGNVGAADNAVYGGGARIITRGSGTVSVTGCSITRNSVFAYKSAYGGGLNLYQDGTGPVELTASTIQDNAVSSDKDGAGPGLLYGGLGSGLLSLTDVTLADNVGWDAAGTTTAGSGGGAYLEPHGNAIRMDACTVTGNDAEYADGLELVAYDGGKLTIESSDILANRGVGLEYISADTSSALTLSDTRIVSNETVGLYLYTPGLYASSTTCTGSDAVDAGIYANGTYGIYGDCALGGGACTFAASGCDLGVEGSAADNVSGDLHIDGVNIDGYEDDETFSCVDSVCG